MNLYSFGMIDERHRFLNKIAYFFYALTEPALKPIREFLPSTGGVDFSPMVLIFLLQFVPTILRFVLLGA